MFSPDGRRLAVAGFVANRIALFDIAIADSGHGKKVVLSGAVEIASPTLRNPHGLCFLDDETVAVANRDGGVQIHALPAPGLRSEPCVSEPTQTIAGSADAPIRTPGSVASFPLGPDTLELLVCHNYSHVVTRHVLDRRRGHASVQDDVLLRRGLAVPDGICISPAGDWIAVSNHDRHEVLLFRRTAGLGPDAAPDAVLRNVICPHGVRFTRDQRHVVVADAHARYVNVYACGEGGWKGAHDPCSMVPVLDWATYLRGRSNPEEGGPKGIAIDPGMNVLACTTEFQTLAFFDLARVLGRRRRPDSWPLRYVQWRLARAIHRRKPELYGWLLPVWR